MAYFAIAVFAIVCVLWIQVSIWIDEAEEEKDER